MRLSAQSSSWAHFVLLECLDFLVCGLGSWFGVNGAYGFGLRSMLALWAEVLCRLLRLLALLIVVEVVLLARLRSLLLVMFIVAVLGDQFW